MAEVLDVLVSGRAVQHFVTVPEGLTSWEVVELLRAEPLLTGEIDEVPPEGVLAPDTYSITRGEARSALLDRMQAAQRRILDAAWEARAEGLPVKTKEEALILASIIEKETGLPEERDQVASVFVNRLKRGMRLQTDPTVIYGITRGEGPLGRGLTRRELQTRTDWNTYLIDGAAADSDRQSGQGLDRGGAAAGGDGPAVFRGRRQRRARLRALAGRAQPQRREVAADRGGAREAVGAATCDLVLDIACAVG